MKNSTILILALFLILNNAQAQTDTTNTEKVRVKKPATTTAFSNGGENPKKNCYPLFVDGYTKITFKQNIESISNFRNDIEIKKVNDRTILVKSNCNFDSYSLLIKFVKVGDKEPEEINIKFSSVKDCYCNRKMYKNKWKLRKLKRLYKPVNL